ncbi:MAG: hypothetical protein GX786_05460 [Clostridiales bacterium]|nr:hypothetical protein [Clostridiales bacterium]
MITGKAGKSGKVIPAWELYTYANTKSGNIVQTGYAMEEKITSGIAHVVMEEIPRIFFLTDHGEVPMEKCDALITQLHRDNYLVEPLSLFKETNLEKGEVLMILSPTRDLTQQEYEMISQWMEEGGRLLYACDASVDMENIPYFHQLLSRYSLAFEEGMVIESNQFADYWMNSPMYLVPAIQTEAKALDQIKKTQKAILPGARGVTGPTMPLSGFTYEKLMTTSRGSYIKKTDSEVFTQEAQDPVGSFPLAQSIQWLNEEKGEEMRAVFIGSLYTIMDNSLLNASNNLDMTKAFLRWLTQRENNISIPAREMANTTMVITSAGTAWRIFAITLILPVFAVMIGFFMYIRRRKK